MHMALKPIIDVPIAKSIERTKECILNSRVFPVEPTMILGERFGHR